MTFTVLWVLSDRISEKTGPIVGGGRFSMLGDDGSLLIKSVEKDDSGQYTCQASNSEGLTAITTKLEIKGICHRRERMLLVSPPPTYSIHRAVRCDVFIGTLFFMWGFSKCQVADLKCLTPENPLFSTSLLFSSCPDPTQIIEPPQDLKILRGTMAQFICQADYDSSLRKEFEILWARGGEETYLNSTEDARYECHPNWQWATTWHAE